MWPRLPLNFTVQLFLIIFLTTSNLFVESQHVRNDIAVESETEDFIPQGSSTLAFVFDVTGSMYDDLVQVIEGAAKILAITLSKRERPLYNYALVPFHDPEIGPVTITTDPEEFKKNLRDLYVQGGGDCPEMSLSAIETALTISLPSSFIYVFTDARAKDFDLTENVLKLIQEKQSQVVFVMTGDCGNRSHVGFQAYEDIAATSSGQLFMLNKSDVDEVLTFVSLSIQARKVHLLAVNNEESGSKVFVLPVDPALREFVVSVSGDNPSISLIDPMGQEITKENGLVELLGIDNVYIVTVKEPKPGSWKLTASSQSTNQLRVTGLSTLDFVPGYSKKPVFRLEDALHRPIDGIPTYMIINATGLEPPGVFTKLELLNLQGQTIREFPLQLNVSNPSIYTIPMFLPPSEFFHLRVSGIDKQNYLFHRLSSTAVSPLKPVAPRVKTTTKTPGYYGDTATLTCNVDSLIPYTVLWEKDSSPLGKSLYYADSGEATWEISNVNTYSEGFYTCTAKSTAGEGQATTFLDVTEPPPSIDIPLNVSVLPGRNAVLTCTAYSTVQFNMTWTKPDSFVVLSRHPRVKFLSNGSLEIREVNQADGGRYQCIASNEGGSSVKDVFLAIQEMPKVSINMRNVTFISGDNITISCSSRGLPAPSLYWTKDDLKLTNGPKITVSKDGVLNIFNASTSESGLYACIASNTAGTDKKSLHVTYIEAARIRLLRRKVLVEYGETAKLNCPAKGIPPPIITWFKEGIPVLSSGFTEVQPNGDLVIVGTKEMDSGEYTCIATNSAGSDSDVITLDVGSEPFILQPPYDIGVDIGMNISVPCVSYGFPRPQTSWYKKDDSLETNKRAKIGEDGTLFIRDLQVEDEGTYVCVVENQFGKEEVSAYLRITGIVHPVIAFSNPEINVIKGSHTTITCQILIGNPPPTIRWLKDGKPINTDVQDSLTLTDDGSLFISKAKVSDAGKYICVASNIAGNSSFTSTVKVQVPPVIGHSPSNYTAIKDTTVTLRCPAHGTPKPTITWQRNGQIISPNDPSYYIRSDGSLQIDGVHTSDSGTYVCMASNPAGVNSKNIHLIVHVAPSIIGDVSQVVTVTLGEPITLPCHAESIPPPTKSWTKENLTISRNNLHYEVKNSGSLHISRVESSDSGVYICTISNVVGDTKKEIRLKVNVPPRISPGPSHITAVVGDSVILPCESIGDPVPDVRWNHNEWRLNMNSEDFLLLDSGSLQISNVKVKSGGRYRCSITSIAGSDTKDITLTVQEPPNIADTPKVVDSFPNSRVTIPCPVTGFPRPHITWYKDGKVVDTSDHGLRVRSDGSLFIMNTEDEDRGYYTCHAVNDAGSANITLLLNINVAPKIKDGPDHVNAIVNNPVLLECEVSGNPEPEVRWQKNGQYFNIDDITVRILDVGSLQIDITRRTDGGRYTCIADSIAGTDTKDIFLTVQEPPIIDKNVPTEVEGLKNNRLFLHCPTSGSPRPEITWYKNNKRIDFDPNVLKMSNGSLMISSAKADDSGQYTCKVHNPAGATNLTIDVTIMEKPVIKKGPKEVDVTVGEPVVLPCEADGKPAPNIMWQKDFKTLSLDGQSMKIMKVGSLSIANTRRDDAGNYMCMASNEKGVDSITIRLNVHERPSIITTGEHNITTTAHEDVRLPCEAQGTPIPNIKWLRNGQQLSGNEFGFEILKDGSLNIYNGESADSGVYQCIAENPVGVDTKEYYVTFNVPPRIAEGPNQLTVILGNPVILPCEASGDPLPTVEWKKDSHLLMAFGQVRRQLEIGSLQIDSTRAIDTGVYVCTVSNIAGTATRTVKLTIQEPPTIIGGLPRNITSIVNTEVTLRCSANGIPPPKIIWLKKARLLPIDGNELRQLSDGSLRIKNVQPYDSGIYICMASSPAGNATINIDLTVNVPPRLRGSDIVTEKTLISNQPLFLECPIEEAVPAPSIRWTKDGLTLSSAQDGLLIMSGGRILQIPNVELTDAGRYKCIADNPAGNSSKIYDVIVHVPPSIEESEFPIDKMAIESHPVTLECESIAIPPPVLTWLKDGQPVTPNDRGIKITTQGRYLQIDNVQLFHEAEYTCVSSNEAGNSTKIINLSVLTPPNMEDSDLPNDLKVIQHKPAALECATDANPSPTITWYKNGNRLNPHSRLGPRILRGNTLLQIYSSQVTDIGQYQCVATNVAGNSSKIFNLDVLVPPTIGDGDKYKTVLVNANVTLSCEVYGLPKPKVTWYKDQLKLPAVNKDKKYTIFSSGSLLLSAAKISHTGEYTCHVSNEAGNITRVITLEVQVPPSIEDRIEDIRTIEGDHVDLICRASGTPPPKIIWHRGGNVIDDNTPGYVLHDDGRLSIRSTSVSDAGAYNCVAQNPAGAAYKKIKLQVQVPPTIQESFQQFVVIEDQQVTMECTSTGTPAPEIRWQIKDEDISHNDMRYRMLPTGALQIPFARREDTGMFKCIAENAAGKAEQFMGLQVNVPPSIYPDKQAYHVLIQENIGLQCNSDGTPQPTVTWEKDGRGVANTDRHHIADDGELYITNTQEVDNGKYICRAINVAGRASREMILTVQVPPKFTVMPIAQRLSANDVLHLVCEAVGVPVPELTWQHNGEYIPTARSINGRSELTIYNVRKEDTGTYACIAENAAGKEKRVTDIWVQVPPTDFVPPRNQTVTRAHTVELTCSADGDPAPNIIWSKNSNPVHFTNRVRKSNNGSLVIYGTTSEDAGDYKCIAENSAGVREGVATLAVRSKPELTIEPPEAMIVDQGDAILIDCQAEGDPQPSIEWWTATSMITSNGRNMILPNNTLYIFPAQIEDNGRYACKAINTVGDTTRATLVTVRVHGEWSEWQSWGACSVSCGRGLQTRMRACDNPLPANGGRDCRGSTMDDRVCEPKTCPINGQYGRWSEWSECSKSCGRGFKSRDRHCNDPVPQYGGKACTGKSHEQVPCNIKPCPVDGKWGPWSPWNECSETCGEGTETRTRQCNNPAPKDGGLQCLGSDVQSQMCKIQTCSVDGKWGTWNSWQMCSKSCGTGKQTRERTCSNPAPRHGGRPCDGQDKQENYCNTEGCPVHGNWSTWEEWGECSASCNGGQQRRYRTCNNPRPSHGGRFCQGTNTQMKSCNLQECSVDGRWSEWGDWTECSLSCDGGEKTRRRTCTEPSPSYGGRPCQGDSSHVARCNLIPCPDGPADAVGNVIGEINGIDFGIARLYANITRDGNSKRVHAKIYDIPESVGYWMRKLISLLTPIYWTSALEIDEAVNGYTLTNGVFRRETQVEFATGEILTMTHKAHGVDENGQLQIDVVIKGEVPKLPLVDIRLKPYTEDYIQTNNGEIYAYSTRMFSMDGHSLPYAWNHSIHYDPRLGRMPFLVEKLHAVGLGVDYDSSKQVLQYEISTSISKGEPSNQCPEGFYLDASGPFCKDNNECNTGQKCSHHCHNKPGGFTCSCPDGMMLGTDGRTCEDVNECLYNNGGCLSSQDCVNTEGSFHCTVNCEKGYRRTATGTSCADINECTALRNLCHQLCLNTIGSYRCSCDHGYELIGSRGICVDINECESGYNPCQQGKECKNLKGGYRCINACEAGLERGRNGTCVDINECHVGSHDCSHNQVCLNTYGSYTCLCPRGFRSQGRGKPCIDVNECTKNPGLCSYECRNLPGDYECICPPDQHQLANKKICVGLKWRPNNALESGCGSGYRSISGGCEDINECLQSNSCQHECENTDGSYICTCPHGYRLKSNGRDCRDINECLQSNSCQHECENTDGSYICTCPHGYRLKSNGRDCRDIDECHEQNIDCGSNRMCFNQRGGYECVDIPCPANYERTERAGYCVRKCPYNDVHCRRDVLEYMTLSLANGIRSHQDLIRLFTKIQDGQIHENSFYKIIQNTSRRCGCTCDCSTQVPFNIRHDRNGKGVVYTLEPLTNAKTYQMTVEATGYNDAHQIEYQTTFVIFISVSVYPY